LTDRSLVETRLAFACQYFVRPLQMISEMSGSRIAEFILYLAKVGRVITSPTSGARTPSIRYSSFWPGLTSIRACSWFFH
jgi:hypothetical protein